MLKSFHSKAFIAIFSGVLILAAPHYVQAQDFEDPEEIPEATLADVIVSKIEESCSCPDEESGLDKLEACLTKYKRKAMTAFPSTALRFLSLSKSELKGDLSDALDTYYTDCEDSLVDPGDDTDPTDGDPNFDPSQGGGF